MTKTEFDNGIYYNGDCMEGMKEMRLQIRKFINYIINVVFKIALPKSEYPYPRFTQISILRNIECFPFLLSFIKSFIKQIIPMPIIAVKLNNYIFPRQISIHCKFIIDYVLGNVIYTQSIQHSIYFFFKTVRAIPHLRGSYGKQSHLFIRVVISAFFRTIFSILFNKRRGYIKTFLTHLAYQIYFIPALIKIVALDGTANSFSPSCIRNVKNRVAPFTFFINTISLSASFATMFPKMFMITFLGAKFDFFNTRFSNNFTATYTRVCSYFVFHNANIRTISPTQKPIKLYKWLLSKYAKQGDLIFDSHVGSGSSLIACEDMNFKYIGYELDKDYYEASCKRIKRHTAQLKIEF